MEYKCRIWNMISTLPSFNKVGGSLSILCPLQFGIIGNCIIFQLDIQASGSGLQQSVAGSALSEYVLVFSRAGHNFLPSNCQLLPFAHVSLARHSASSSNLLGYEKATPISPSFLQFAWNSSVTKQTRFRAIVPLPWQPPQLETRRHLSAANCAKQKLLSGHLCLSTLRSTWMGSWFHVQLSWPTYRTET